MHWHNQCSSINNDVGIDWFILKFLLLQISFLFKFSSEIFIRFDFQLNSQHDKCRFIFKINIQKIKRFCWWKCSYLLLRLLLLFVLMVIESTLNYALFFQILIGTKEFHYALLRCFWHAFLIDQKFEQSKEAETKQLRFENEFECIEKFLLTQNRSAASAKRSNERGWEQ